MFDIIMKKRPLYLVPMGFIFFIAPFMPATAGDMVYVFLLGAATCILPITCSSGWPKYTGILFCLLFLVTAGLALRTSRERDPVTATNILKQGTKRVEHGDPPNTHSPSAQGVGGR